MSEREFPARTGFKCIVWDHGREAVAWDVHGTAAGTEIRMSDGRTYQMFVDADGHVSLRCWGNTPILLGNGNRTAFRAVVPFETPTYDEHGNRLTEATDG